MKKRRTRKNAQDRYVYQLQRKFDMSPEDYVRLLLLQGRRCAVCRRHRDELQQDLVVDHCHASGRVRGLLCRACNQALGLVRDQVVVLDAMIVYLKRAQEVDAKFCAIDNPLSSEI